MSAAFTLKRTARLPSRAITLSGNGITTLQGIDSCAFVYEAAAGGTPVSLTATVTDAANMVIRVDFGATDVATVGTYKWHIKVTQGGLDMYFPEVGFYTFAITPTLE